MCKSWQEVGKMYPDWEDSQYVAYLRMPKSVFFTVCGLYGNFLRRKDTPMRAAIPVEKRMAIHLFWLAYSVSVISVAGLFCIGKSTPVAIVHNDVHVLRKHMISSAILFPAGSELDQVLCDFEALCHLPRCAGALDGTFMDRKAYQVWRFIFLLQPFSLYHYFGMCRCKRYLHICQFRKTRVCR